MADVSDVLNSVADGLRGPLLTSVRELIASEAAARQEAANLRAELDGTVAEDVRESDAAANVKAAFDEVTSELNSDEVPVDPIPPVDEEPTDGEDEVPENPQP